MRTSIFVGVLWLTVAVPASAELYQWTDANGIIHIVDEASTVPDTYRQQVKVYRGTHPAVSPSPSAALLAPSHTYAEFSQGAFAQRLALDLQLIHNSAQDGLGPLSGVGIRPAGGWQVHQALTPEALYEVLAAARRAADAKRIALSADGIEAVVRQAAAPFLAVPPIAQSPVAEWGAESEESGDEEEQQQIIIEEAPREVIEVIHEPYYVPVIVGAPHFHGRHHHRNQHETDESQFSPSLEPTRSIRRGLTQMPFGASPSMPFGASRPMPFGASPPARAGMFRGR